MKKWKKQKEEKDEITFIKKGKSFLTDRRLSVALYDKGEWKVKKGKGYGMGSISTPVYVNLKSKQEALKYAKKYMEKEEQRNKDQRTRRRCKIGLAPFKKPVYKAIK